jgi:DNA adenine methylase
MSISNSPLRYPGGKQILSRILGELIRVNGAQGGTYAEPFAGGAGAALTLLFGEHVERVLINDADHCVYAFWKTVLHHTDDFLSMLDAAKLNDHEWCRQRDVYRRRHRRKIRELGFATFYLNRCNRSGIIATGGPIGGRKQKGKWKIDARFGRKELARRVEQIRIYRDRISISNLDAIAFLGSDSLLDSRPSKTFIYLDPPYYSKGHDLYLNYYQASDHADLATLMRRRKRFSWVMSYDNVPQIRALYSACRLLPFDLSYSASRRRAGSELLIAPRDLVFPSPWKGRVPPELLTNASRIKGDLEPVSSRESAIV